MALLKFELKENILVSTPVRSGRTPLLNPVAYPGPFA